MIRLSVHGWLRAPFYTSYLHAQAREYGNLGYTAIELASTTAWDTSVMNIWTVQHDRMPRVLNLTSLVALPFPQVFLPLTISSIPFGSGLLGRSPEKFYTGDNWSLKATLFTMTSRREQIARADEELLATLGYKQEFKREFKPLEVCLNILLSFGVWF